MKASILIKALVTLIKAQEPALVRGTTGVGKTSLYEQAAKLVDHDLLVTRLSLIDPVDLSGLPMVTADATSWKVPDYFPREGCRPTIWFFDEWSQGSVAVQNAAGQLLNERRLGNYRLPDNVVIMAASNYAKDKAGTNRLPSHIADRFTFLDLEVDVDDWVRWALQAGIQTEVIAFIKFRPELLSKFDPNIECCPSPRSWSQISRIMAAGPCAETEMPLYAGKIGEGAAAEFMGFLRIVRTLPSPDSIILNPTTEAVPSDPATLYALAGVLARRCTPMNIDAITQYAARMPPEFSVTLIRQATQRDAALQQTRAFIQWSADNQEVFN